ncbi:MAG: hypothetical protein ACREBR_01330 [bacterium]
MQTLLPNRENPLSVEYNEWHTPVKYLLHVPRQSSNGKAARNFEKEDEEKEQVDLFTIVRNPYNRVISEFYCPLNGARPLVQWDKSSKMNTKMENTIIAKITPARLRVNVKALMESP